MKTYWIPLLGLAIGLSLPCNGETPAAAQNMEAVVSGEDEIVADTNDSETSNRDDLFHIQVLRNPYDLARFYRSRDTLEPPVFGGESLSTSESAFNNPYTLSSFYRNSPRDDDSWFVIAPLGYRNMNRSRRARSESKARALPSDLVNDRK
jgi:hypothetical protein